MLTALEQTLLDALLELDRAGKSLRTPGAKPDWPALFARLDELAGRLPRDTDPTLLHYLQKKSYEKARLFLEGRNAENQAGNCPHV